MTPRRRALTKALTWRAGGFVVLGVVSLIVTGSLATSTTVAALHSAIQIPAYYLHERVWDRGEA